MVATIGDENNGKRVTEVLKLAILLSRILQQGKDDTREKIDVACCFVV